MPAAIPAAIGAVGGIIAARSGAKAAKSAAESEQAGVEAGIAEQRRQFDIAQQQGAPFRQAGLSALQQQLALLGLPGLQPEQFAQPVAAPAVSQGPRKFFGLGGIAQAAFEQDRIRSLGGQQPQGPGPGPSAGVQIPEAISREQALAAFAETPGQQFLRERQERSLLRSAGAIGGLGGGNIRTALQEQAFGRAATQLGEFQNRLAALTGGAQTATAGLAELGGQTAGQISRLAQAGGQAQASGILGAQQARAQGIQNIAGALGGAFSGGFGGGSFGNTVAARSSVAGGGLFLGPPSGSISSDRRMKEDINDLDLKECYDAVVSMPLKSWRYLKSAGIDQGLHFGPMAQDAPECIKIKGKEMLNVHDEIMLIAGAIQYMKEEGLLWQH